MGPRGIVRSTSTHQRLPGGRTERHFVPADARPTKGRSQEEPAYPVRFCQSWSCPASRFAAGHLFMQAAQAQAAQPQPATPAPNDPVDRLERLAALKDRGLITDEEFDQQKRRILGEI